MTRKIFVYGSLLEGLFNYEKYLNGKVLTRKPARTRGELYHQIIPGYPAMIEGNDYVYGELIEVLEFENTLKILDQIENFYGKGNPDNEYNRMAIEVELLEDGNIETAFAYVYNLKDYGALKRGGIYIKDGNWKKFYMESKLYEEKQYLPDKVNH